jgi:outer membrane protein TolC
MRLARIRLHFSLASLITVGVLSTVVGTAGAQSPPLLGPGGALVPASSGGAVQPPSWRFPSPSVSPPALSGPAAGITIAPVNLKVPQAAPMAALGLPVVSSATGAPSITLDEAKQRVLSNSKLLQLAAENIRGKEFATRAAQADYFPQIVGSLVYFHFNDSLGEVLTLGGRTRTGPLGNPFTLPTNAVDVAVLNQDSALGTLTMVQPITALLKVRQGVKIARADEQIAQADLEKAARALSIGTEQLYLGLLAAQRLRAGTAVALEGAEAMAKVQPSVQVRIAVVEARQGLQALDKQIGELWDQLAILLDVPTCTKLDLIEPPLPISTVTCAEEAVNLALAASPEVRAAEQDIVKANAAVAAAKVDYLPNVLVFGGYANQTIAGYIQQNIGYVGASVNYTFLDWGKRHNIIRERDTLVYMATLKVQQTSDEVRQKALKAFRDYRDSAETLKLAGEMVQLRKEAQKAAAMPAAAFQAAKDLMTAEVDQVKADLALRVAAAQLLNLIGHQQ